MTDRQSWIEEQLRIAAGFQPRAAVESVPLFCYGTFCEPGILDEVIDRSVMFRSDCLEGVRHDAGEDGFSYLVPASDDETYGFLVDLSDEEYGLTDGWEQEYTRQKTVTLKSGTVAWVYEIKLADET
jgi:hypothetical protein